MSICHNCLPRKDLLSDRIWSGTVLSVAVGRILASRALGVLKQPVLLLLLMAAVCAPAASSRAGQATSTPVLSSTDTPTFVNTPVLGCGLACNSTTLVVDCWNLSSCNICGGGLYDCPSALSCCSFNDPCANGQVVQQIAVVVYGTACTSPNTCFSTTINGTTVGTTPSTAYSCACSSCTTWLHTSSCYTSGFPGYVYGGVNNLCYVPCGFDQLCLDRMEVTLCCVVPQSPTRTITCPPTLSRTCTAWNTNTISRTFTRSPTF